MTALQTFKASAHLQDGVQVKVASRNFEFIIDEPKAWAELIPV